MRYRLSEQVAFFRQFILPSIWFGSNIFVKCSFYYINKKNDLIFNIKFVEIVEKYPCIYDCTEPARDFIKRWGQKCEDIILLNRFFKSLPNNWELKLNNYQNFSLFM